MSEIDLLRFIAAVIVMLFHYTFRGYAADGYSPMPYPALAPVSKYGYLGVELFFLISGFVILMTASSGSLRKFMVSRIVRLYPAFWFCCTATFLLILAFGGERFSASIRQYLLNMTMLNEFIGVPSIDGVYWSLAVEIKFYVMVGFVLLIGQIRRAQSFLILWLIATVALNVFPIERLRSILIADYAPYFIAGATYFLVYSSGLSKTRAVVIIAAWVVAIKDSLPSAKGMERHYHAEFDPMVIAGLVTAFFLVMFLVSVKRMGILGKREWMTIGALTYPLYLIHQIVGYMIFNMAYPTMSRHLVLWGTVSVVLLAAYLINTQVERRYSRKLKRTLENAFASTREKSAI